MAKKRKRVWAKKERPRVGLAALGADPLVEAALKYRALFPKRDLTPRPLDFARAYLCYASRAQVAALESALPYQAVATWQTPHPGGPTKKTRCWGVSAFDATCLAWVADRLGRRRNDCLRYLAADGTPARWQGPLWRVRLRVPGGVFLAYCAPVGLKLACRLAASLRGSGLACSLERYDDPAGPRPPRREDELPVRRHLGDLPGPAEDWSRTICVPTSSSLRGGRRRFLAWDGAAPRFVLASHPGAVGVREFPDTLANRSAADTGYWTPEWEWVPGRKA